MDSDNQINVRYMTDFYEMHCIWYFIASAHCIYMIASHFGKQQCRELILAANTINK